MCKILFLFFTSLSFAYIPKLSPVIDLSAQKNRIVKSFYAKSSISLPNTQGQEIIEELWYSNNGILKSKISKDGQAISVKITRPDRSEIYGQDVKKSEDNIGSLIPGMFLFSNKEYLEKLYTKLKIPLTINLSNPSAQFVNFGFGTWIEYSQHPNQPKGSSLFYSNVDNEAIYQRWSNWFANWKAIIDATPIEARDSISKQMKQVNPKYILREWFLVPAYQQAAQGNYSLIRELNEVMSDPYAEQSVDTEKKYYRLKPSELFNVGGVSHLSCSS